MSIDLVTKFLPFVDEVFSTASKHSLFTNQDYSWEGAAAIKIYKVSTASMNDYGRHGASSGNWSRYGEIADLDATTEAMTLTKDRSFTFVIDRLDQNETGDALNAASALARQLREVVIPEVDAHVINKMISKAGTVFTRELTQAGMYSAIINATKALDLAEVPESGRVMIVTPDSYMKLKCADGITLQTNAGQEMRLSGGIGTIDGMTVVRIPSSRVPAGFGFMICHPCACVAPTKLAAYKTHADPPGINGSLIEGRIVYDAFVTDNKVNAIYVHRDLTPVTVTADDKTKVVDADDPTFTATISPELPTGDTLTYTLSRTAGETAGTYDITPTGEAIQGKYEATYAKGTLTITSE